MSIKTVSFNLLKQTVWSLIIVIKYIWTSGYLHIVIVKYDKYNKWYIINTFPDKLSVCFSVLCLKPPGALQWQHSAQRAEMCLHCGEKPDTTIPVFVIWILGFLVMLWLIVQQESKCVFSIFEETSCSCKRITRKTFSGSFQLSVVFSVL